MPKTLQGKGSAIKGGASQCGKMWQGPHPLEESGLERVEKPSLGVHLPVCDNPLSRNKHKSMQNLHPLQTDCLFPATHDRDLTGVAGECGEGCGCKGFA